MKNTERQVSLKKMNDTTTVKKSDRELVFQAFNISDSSATDYENYDDSLLAEKIALSEQKARKEFGTKLGDEYSVKQYKAILDKTIEKERALETYDEEKIKFDEDMKKLAGYLDADGNIVVGLEETLARKQSLWNRAESNEISFLEPDTWGNWGRIITNRYPEGHLLNKEGTLFMEMDKLRKNISEIKEDWMTSELSSYVVPSDYAGRGAGTYGYLKPSRKGRMEQVHSNYDALDATLTRLTNDWELKMGGVAPKPTKEGTPDWMVKRYTADAKAETETRKLKQIKDDKDREEAEPLEDLKMRRDVLHGLYYND